MIKKIILSRVHMSLMSRSQFQRTKEQGLGNGASENSHHLNITPLFILCLACLTSQLTDMQVLGRKKLP